MSTTAAPIQSITANLFVESIEDCLPFWVERLGFTVTAEVPHEGHIGFVILALGDVELMLQSRASVAGDIAPLASESFRSMLYIRVGDLAPLRKALAGAPHVVPERRTFYGADEIIVRDPAGNVVAFAHRRE
ncbi:MAG TPA: VOC family protein [Nannocystaceae bacterium]|nr:VOC family protein [Nannocystaceae bacterium]